MSTLSLQSPLIFPKSRLFENDSECHKSSNSNTTLKLRAMDSEPCNSFGFSQKVNQKKPSRDRIESHDNSLVYGRSNPCETSKFRESKFLTRFAVETDEYGVDYSEPEVGTSHRFGSSVHAEAKSGRVICNSKGCFPAYEGENQTSELKTEPMHSTSSSYERSSLSHRHIHDPESSSRSLVTQDFAEFLDEIWMDSTLAEKYYENALKQAPFDSNLLISFAKFIWKTKKSFSRADELFNRALKESPNDDEVLAGYALFLWESNA